jgi:hypothetical protein
LRVLIGNKGILQKNGIEVPRYEKQTTAATELFLCVG